MLKHSLEVHSLNLYDLWQSFIDRSLGRDSNLRMNMSSRRNTRKGRRTTPGTRNWWWLSWISLRTWFRFYGWSLIMMRGNDDWLIVAIAFSRRRWRGRWEENASLRRFYRLDRDSLRQSCPSFSSSWKDVSRWRAWCWWWWWRKRGDGRDTSPLVVTSITFPQFLLQSRETYVDRIRLKTGIERKERRESWDSRVLTTKSLKLLREQTTRMGRKKKDVRHKSDEDEWAFNKRMKIRSDRQRYRTQIFTVYVLTDLVQSFYFL